MPIDTTVPIPRGGGIEYLIGSALEPEPFPEATAVVIAHIVNDIGAWGGGFTGAINKLFGPGPMYFYQKANREGGLSLGMICLYHLEGANVFIANLCAQEGVSRQPDGRPPIRYAALDSCLGGLSAWAASKASGIHMPRMGAGLAGGDWDTIAEIIEHRLCQQGIPVRVYDLPGQPFARPDRQFRLILDMGIAGPSPPTLWMLIRGQSEPVLLGQADQVLGDLGLEAGGVQAVLDWRRYQHSMAIAGSRAPTYPKFTDILGRSV